MELRKQRKKSNKSDILVTVVLSIFALTAFIPFIWMVSSSLKQNNEVFALPIRWIPKSFKWENYIDIWKQVKLATFFKNTIFLSIIITSLQLITSSFAAYAFSKLKFKGRDTLFLIYIAVIAVPFQAFMIPQFIMIRKIGLADNLWALVILQAFSSFGVFLMKQYYDTIPNELCESARIDGLSEWGIYLRIVLPLIKPAIASLAIIAFVGTWNDYLGPFIYLSSPENLTIQVGLKMFISLYSAKYAYIMAASVVSIIPVAILFFSLQKYFIEGIATSGLKG